MAVFQTSHTIETLAAVVEDLVTRVHALEAPDTPRDFGAPFDTPEECNAGTCSYVMMYLAAGPADLTHAGFHAAEANAAAHFEICEAIQTGDSLCRTCQMHEKRCRA